MASTIFVGISKMPMASKRLKKVAHQVNRSLQQRLTELLMIAERVEVCHCAHRDEVTPQLGAKKASLTNLTTNCGGCERHHPRIPDSAGAVYRKNEQDQWHTQSGSFAISQM